MQVVIAERFHHLAGSCITLSPVFTRNRLEKELGVKLANNKGDYSASKRASREAVRKIMPRDQFLRCERAFSKLDAKAGKTDKRVDAIEALLMCLCM